MSVGLLPPPTIEQEYPLLLYRFKVEEYQRMGECRILTPGHRVELLEGLVARKMNLNPAHAVSLGLIVNELRKVISTDWHERVQLPVTTSDSEPEPDVTVVRGDVRSYTSRHPVPNDVGVLVEVADSSLVLDRGQKARLYARAEIAVYWIVNLVDRQVEVYTEPSGPGDEPEYAKSTIYAAGSNIPVVLDGAEIAQLKVDDLLP